MDGDLFTGDPATGASTALLTGPTYDFEPVYSRDGTRVAFARRVDSEDDRRYDIYIMAADGSDLRKVTGSPLEDPHWWDLAPDGRTIVTVSSGQADGTLESWPTDGSLVPTGLAPDLHVDAPAFRPPDGAQLLFRGRVANVVGLYVMDADGSNLQALIKPTISGNGDFTLREPRYSPDGSQIAFHQWDDATDKMRLYVMDADGTNRRELAADPNIWFTGWPVWSNDGTRVAVQRGRPNLPEGFGLPYAIVDVATGEVTETGPILPTDGGRVEWAPDDSAILLVPNSPGGSQILLDPAGGPATTPPWTSDSYPNWQRMPD